MKTKVYGFFPTETIGTMPKGSTRFFLFHNIFVTQENIFIPYDSGVYKTREEIGYLFEDENCTIQVTRTENDNYSFGFGDIFKTLCVPVYPKLVNDYLEANTTFIKVGNIDVEIIQEENCINQGTFLQETLQEALSNEDYLEAARIKALLNKIRQEDG